MNTLSNGNQSPLKNKMPRYESFQLWMTSPRKTQDGCELEKKILYH